MRILIVSWHFPPYNAVGAVRVTKLAAHLRACGFDVRVLSARDQPLPETMSRDVPDDIVTYADWIDVEWPAKRLSARFGSGQPDTRPYSSTDRRSEPSALTGLRQILRAISRVYFTATMLPDKQIGWYPSAMRAGRRLFRNWQPDLVYASGPPFTSLLVASRLARRARVPWFAELRDPWFGTGYIRTDMPEVYERLQGVVERRVLRSAAAIVTTADALTDMYANRYRKPTRTIYNGYDSSDTAVACESQSLAPDDDVRITYTGHIYPGRRDPTALFQAIASLSENERARIRVEFFGSQENSLRPVAEECGVSDRVWVHPPVPYDRSLAIQRASDALLLLQWNDPQEALHIPAKLFEYLGAARPIIGLGYEQGVPAQIVRDRDAGIYSNDPGALAQYLSALLADKRKRGAIPDLPETVRAGFSRRAQFEGLRAFVEKVTAAGQPGGAASISRVPIDLSASEPLRLVVVCDTEEEFDWHAPFDRSARGITHLRAIDTVQAIFDRHGVRPVYAVDYPVADQPAETEALRAIVQDGRAEVGTHLQPWVSPPFDEQLSVPASFPGNLPASLERAKLDHLTARIEQTFGTRPVIYKAGRYGLGPDTPRSLEDLGYLVDVSAAPPRDLSSEGGPDFTEWDARPFWFHETKLLGLPNTGAVVGRMRRTGGYIYQKFGDVPFAGAVLSRFGLAERLSLSNEGHGLDDLKRLSRHILDQGCRTLVLSFHSPSIVPGFTPYVQTEADARQFMADLDDYLRFAIQELGAQPASPLDVRAACVARCARTANDGDDGPGVGQTDARSPAVVGVDTR